ncbi:hypothetical protein OK016_24830 [Vibrio chagasii]|nr:hypothetical protein [Vibrio chagasii]
MQNKLYQQLRSRSAYHHDLAIGTRLETDSNQMMIGADYNQINIALTSALVSDEELPQKISMTPSLVYA